MPNCFSLTRKSEPENGPVILQHIDAEMCKHFGVRCDPKYYYLSWKDAIGLQLAMGKTLPQIRESMKALVKECEIDMIAAALMNPKDEWFAEELKSLIRLVEITEWMDANFISDAWYSPK